MTTRRLPRKVRGGLWARLEESVCSLVGRFKGLSRVDLGSYHHHRVLQVLFNRGGVRRREKEPCRPRCRILSRPSQLRVVIHCCAFLRRQGRLTVCTSINRSSTIRIYIVRRDGSFLFRQVIDEASSVFLLSTDLIPCPSHIRGARVWGWVEVGVQRTASGKVRERSKSRTRRSEDERREHQRGAAGSGPTARRPSATAKMDRRSVGFMFDFEAQLRC